jgi:NAD(P)-dependent dehydrogenase (short-subunit alcohol dehydrogenase family)
MVMSGTTDQTGTHTTALTGSRVLVTGAETASGRALAHAFSRHHARLVLQGEAGRLDSDQCHAAFAAHASGLMCFADPMGNPEQALRFAQRAVTVFGGLDLAVVVIALDRPTMAAAIDADTIEDLIGARVAAAVETGKVIANRMGVTWTDGLIVNVLDVPEAMTEREKWVARMMKAALAAVTRREAVRLAGHGIRVHAIAPDLDADRADHDPMSLDPALAGRAAACDDRWCGPDPEATTGEVMAAIAVHLAIRRNRSLSGLMLTPDTCAGQLVG